MSFTVKELFYTLQGEGANTGRPRSFADSRDAICGRAARRIGATAICRFCDTDFVGTDGRRRPLRRPRRRRGDRAAMARRRPPLVVCTGGEPLLQMTRSWRRAARGGFEVAVETNGRPDRRAWTGFASVPRPVPSWCCAPARAEADLSAARRRAGALRGSNSAISSCSHGRAERERNTQLAVRYCLDTGWRPSLQTQKISGFRELRLRALTG